MALQVCKSCTTRYAPAAACPNCGANEWTGELEADAQQAPQEAAPAVTQAAGGTEYVETEDGPVAVSSSVPGGEADEDKPDYTAYSVRDLVELCRARGIPFSGTSGTLPKADLVARLVEQEG